MDYNELLSHCALFNGFSSDERDIFVKAALHQSVADGHVFLHKGDRNASLYVIASGTVRVTLSGEDTIELASLGRGALIGEMSCWDVSPVTATLTAAGPTEVLQLPVEVVDRLTAEHPQIAIRFWRNMAMGLKARLNRTNKLVEHYVNLSDVLSEDPNWGSLFGRT